MDKKDLIKSLIKFFTVSHASCLSIDVNNDESVLKLILKVISKEIKSPINISFISPSEEFFDNIFPNSKGNIKTGSPYTLGIHTISFYKFEKNIMNNPPENTNILLFYPCNKIKEKDQIKFMDKCKNVQKTVFIDNNITEPYKGLKKYSSEFITLKESAETSYYENMKQRLFNSK